MVWNNSDTHEQTLYGYWELSTERNSLFSQIEWRENKNSDFNNNNDGPHQKHSRQFNCFEYSISWHLLSFSHSLTLSLSWHLAHVSSLHCIHHFEFVELWFIKFLEMPSSWSRSHLPFLLIFYLDSLDTAIVFLVWLCLFCIFFSVFFFGFDCNHTAQTVASIKKSSQQNIKFERCCETQWKSIRW